MRKTAALADPENPVQHAAQSPGVLSRIARRLRGAAQQLPLRLPASGNYSERLDRNDHGHRSKSVSAQDQELTWSVFDKVSSLVIVFDHEGRFVRGNPACERVIGYSLQRMQDQFIWDLFNIPLEADQIRREFEILVKQRVGFTHKTSFKNAQGQVYWLSWSISFILDDQDQVAYIVATGADLTERNQRERQQEAFAALASGLRGELSVEHAYEIILDRLRQFLSAELVAVATSVPNSNTYIFDRAIGAGADDLLGKSFSASEEGPREAVQSLQPCVRSILPNDVPHPQPESAPQLHSVVWVPLVTEGRKVNLIMLTSTNIVNPSETAALAAMAEVASGAINRRILLDETQRRLRRLAALSTINIAISASLDIQVTLRVLVNQITAQLGVDAACILLVDPVTRDLHCAADHGFRSKDVSKTHLWMGQGHAGQAAMQHKSIHIYQDEGIADLFLPERRLESDEFVAYHAVPLSIKGEVKGVLETFHRLPYQPDPEWPQFLETLAAEASIALNNADLMDRLQRNNLALEMAYDSTIEGWALALEMRDRQTENHTRRVAEQALCLAQALGIRGDDLKYIRYGALLHDIGKIGIPDSILNKTGPLDDQEWEKMRRHPEYSRQMLASIPFLSPAMAIPYSHHERWDGSGYPQKLVGLQIPLPARIFAVVDVWDALSFGRVYRDALPEEEVLEYLQKEAGRLFDPEVVAAFVELRHLSAASERRF